jgi:alkanesulfonate monooxygenase SsuD/methylene tetrahydromethanopterin reductase-like flavin-dependent oxidoreductase (luciferase family)
MDTSTDGEWTPHPWVIEGERRVRFGIAFWPLPDWPQLRLLVEQVEAFGFDSYWKEDHPLEEASRFDCWTLLTALAVTTTKLRLGSFVSVINYRSPLMLARLAADVDRLSNGRLVLGLGIGRSADEFQQLGLPFPRVAERQQALEETIAIVRGVWGERPFSYTGKHFQVHEVRVTPGPVQQPHVPLLIAGEGERGTLRQVARYADAANFGLGQVGPAEVRRKLDVLRRYCAEQGRPSASVLPTYMTFPLILAETPEALQPKLQLFSWPPTFAGTPEEACAYFRTLVEAGIRYFIICMHGSDEETLHLLGQRVVPAVTAL